MHINGLLWERQVPAWSGCCLGGFRESLGDPDRIPAVQERAFLGGAAEPG